MSTNYIEMKSGIVKFIKKTAKAKGHEYDTLFMYIPKAVAGDSAFNFSAGEKAKITIVDNKKLIIEKL